MANKRISARRGHVVNLDTQIFHNGVLADPYAIRKIEIYKTAIETSNLLAVIPVLNPTDALYPSPLVKTGVGKYYLPFDVPKTYEVPDVFFDLWYYYPENPCDEDGTGTGTDFSPEAGCDLDDPDLEGEVLKNCHRFWIYPDGWQGTDDLSVINFGFEPMSIHFNKPELRPLEVGLMPLPLYDYDYNLVAPIIPFLEATITVETRNCELLVDAEAMTIGIRQGSYRANPFVLRWTLDTTRFLIGTYRYKVKITMPDGTTRVSKWMIFDVG